MPSGGLMRRLLDWKTRNWWRVSFVRRCEWKMLRGLLRVSPGDSVLEVGSGSGWAAQYVRSLGAEVTASDLASPAFLRNHSVLKERGIRPVVADGQHLPFADACFDHILSVCVLEHIPDAEAAIGECLRVLRPGGSFVFSVSSLPASLLGEELRDRQRELHRVRHTWSSDDLVRVARELGAADVWARPALCSPMAVAALAARLTTGSRAERGRLPQLLSIPRDYFWALRVERAEARLAASGPQAGLIVVARFTKQREARP
ncbi:MAG: class I SAM-dependent methyltransferase [Armatimonadetes bacterium]|nr:class I SAM-dependent methyltransferase [Armatimonadota bacterium]